VSKEKRMPKEYAIVVSLMIFFTIVILVGGIRIYLVTKDKFNIAELSSIKIIEEDTNIDLANYNLRIANSIRDTYGVDVYYGRVPGLESVNAIPVTDDQTILKMLIQVNNMLQVYPEGLIKEIESKGYELSIYLVDYFTVGVEALANRNSIGQMKIYISNTTDINRVLHHEYYHILDYYIKLESDENVAYLLWDKYNPEGFEYSQDVGKLNSKYVYNKDKGAYFVTLYAKFSEKEDRAETFAEMITASKEEDFFKADGAIKGKINIIKKVLYNTFKTVRDEQSLAWD